MNASYLARIWTSAPYSVSITATILAHAHWSIAQNKWENISPNRYLPSWHFALDQFTMFLQFIYFVWALVDFSNLQESLYLFVFFLFSFFFFCCFCGCFVLFSFFRTAGKWFAMFDSWNKLMRLGFRLRRLQDSCRLNILIVSRLLVVWSKATLTRATDLPGKFQSVWN